MDQYTIHVEHYVKTADHQWLLSDYADPDAILSLRVAERQLQVAELYENIDFAALDG